jgi:hypothetical protein
LVFFDGRVVRHGRIAQHRQKLNIDHALKDLEGHRLQRNPKAGQY